MIYYQLVYEDGMTHSSYNFDLIESVWNLDRESVTQKKKTSHAAYLRRMECAQHWIGLVVEHVQVRAPIAIPCAPLRDSKGGTAEHQIRAELHVGRPGLRVR